MPHILICYKVKVKVKDKVKLFNIYLTYATPYKTPRSIGTFPYRD